MARYYIAEIDDGRTVAMRDLESMKTARDRLRQHAVTDYEIWRGKAKLASVSILKDRQGVEWQYITTTTDCPVSVTKILGQICEQIDYRSFRRVNRVDTIEITYH